MLIHNRNWSIEVTRGAIANCRLNFINSFKGQIISLALNVKQINNTSGQQYHSIVRVKIEILKMNYVTKTRLQ